MSEEGETSKTEVDDAARREFVEFQRREAKVVQAGRLFFWMILCALPLAIASIVLGFRHVLGIELSAATISYIVIGWFILRILALPSAIVESDGGLAAELMDCDKPISRDVIMFVLRKNLYSIQFADILMSPLLIFSLAISLDLLAADWQSAAVGAGWFIGIGLYALYSHLTPQQKRTSGKAGGWHAALLLFLLPSLLNMWWAPELSSQELYAGTGARLLVTLLAMLVVVAMLTVFNTQVEYKLFDALVRLLPAVGSSMSAQFVCRTSSPFKKFICKKRSQAMPVHPLPSGLLSTGYTRLIPATGSSSSTACWPWFLRSSR